MKKITTCLWFNDQAEEAANFYVSVFSGIRGAALGGTNSKVLTVTRYGEEGASASGRPKGTVMTVIFELDGERFMALNGGPAFTFSPAISFIINCDTQEEIDRFWEKLSEGGGVDACGWLHDRYGVSWQVVPAILGDLIQDSDHRKSENVMKAMFQMKKLDIQGLKQAYEQG